MQAVPDRAEPLRPLEKRAFLWRQAPWEVEGVGRSINGDAQSKVPNCEDEEHCGQEA